MNRSEIGGDVAVDFLNTVDWRLDSSRRHERLPTYQHVLAWMKQAALLSDTEAQSLALEADRQPDLAAAEYSRVIDMREDVYRTLNDGVEPKVFQGELSAAHAASRLRADGAGNWRWGPADLDLATPRHRLALEFGRLLTSDSVARFHRCEDQHCGWVFLDNSRQHNRRWCDSADCGNRNRVRAHYVRSKKEQHS